MALIAPTDVFAYITLQGEIIRVDGTDLIDTGGPWLGSIAYQPNNVVSYQNGLFVSLTANFNQPPTAIVNDNWSALVKTNAEAPSSGYLQDQPKVIFCHHVNWGTNTDQVNAAQMPYQGEYPTVGAALDALLYVPLVIESFGNSVGTVEIGQTVTTVGLTWAYNEPADVTVQILGPGIGSIPLGQYNYTDTGVWTSNRTYTLSASDGTSNPSASTTVAFSPKRYWGASADPTPTDAEIIALSSEFASNFNQSRTITANAQYIYFVFPSSFGTPTFTVNGLLNTAWNLTTRTFVNASGYASSYSIWQSNNLLTGVYQIALS